MIIRVFLLLAGIAAGALTAAAQPTAPTTPPLLLISMDGFRWDYCALHPEQTPNLRQLAREGISARGLIPVFPSNTFPNHYSIVTGLYPSHHGIINNHLYDAARREFFHYNRPECVRDGSWWGGEPIWVTAVRQGRKSACSFWVGSEAPVDGVRPTYWKPWDPKATFEPRLEELIHWLTLPAAEQPAIVTFYFEESNSAGHHSGPDSPELVATIQRLDGQLGEIRRRLAAARVDANIVVVSDHGMTPSPAERVLVLDRYVDLNTVQVDFDESNVGLRPRNGASVDSVLEQLKQLPPQAKAYRATELPARFHVEATNPRVPPVWIVLDEGWHMLRGAVLAKAQGHFVKGQHGYDPALPSMHGILIAAGPSFRNSGAVTDAVENVHIYNLLCAALSLKPARNDGDDRLVRAMLK
jgi:predicted AlkP superfamily pyrophosphatase or phosphodiesterase